MIAARISRRSLMDRLLLDGMAWTDAWVDSHQKTVFILIFVLFLIGSAL